ncbi:MAG: beta-glucosidase [Frankiaceae bacterium]|nr:beta-glucosidase [Frankiaceae bacterium]
MTRPTPAVLRPRRRAAGLAAAAALALLAGVLPSSSSLAATPPTGPTVSATPVVLVNDGAVATITVTLDTAVTGDVTVTWATGAGTATAGTDYAAANGTLTFAAGSAAGATRTITLRTIATTGAQVAETIPVTLTVSGATLAGDQPTVVINAHGLPYLDATLPVAQRVRDLMGRMTLAEKVGQMTQAERGAVDSNQGLITTWMLGSLLSGGGSTPTKNDAPSWADMVDGYQTRALATRLQIPLIYGVDSVHGHGNLYGSTIFPHNVGMGSTRDASLVAAEEHVTAIETRATGIPWVFAPCLCVAQDDRWGRTYESYGESPALVSAMETSINGFQGNGSTDLARNDRVLATAKHFAGDGDTTYGSGRDTAGANGSNYPIDQGITQVSRSRFASVDLAPYIPAVQLHNVGSVMPSYSSVDFTDDGLGNPVKMHANGEFLQGWLKDQQGFSGFVISDYNGIHQIPPLSKDDSPTPAQVTAGVNAGIDMMMEPFDYQKFETRLIDEVTAGRVTAARIDDAVTRILTKKFELGLFEHPYADRSNIATIGNAAHRAVARQAAAESQVLLKNSGNVLPLKPTAHIYVAGRSADSLANQTGGWTITWQGSGGSTKGTTIVQGMKQVAPHAAITLSADATAPMAGNDVGVVVVGETPYAEGFGDVGGPLWAYDPVDKNVPREPKSMELQAQDKAVIDKVCSTLPKCVVLVVSGRPQLVSDQLAEIDGLVASWLPGTEGEGVADVLFGNRPFTGQLSLTWPRYASQEPINVGDTDYRPLYPFGYGLVTKTSARGVHAATAHDLAAAKAVVLGKRYAAATERLLITRLRLLVEQRHTSDTLGMSASAAAAVANADVATLKGDRRTALRLLRLAL